jgi:hypothetical protein
MSEKQKRVRTIQQCYKEIMAIDPESAVTENFIRKLCHAGAVKHFKSGVKFLVSLDDLLDYLSFGQYSDTDNN